MTRPLPERDKQRTTADGADLLHPWRLIALRLAASVALLCAPMATGQPPAEHGSAKAEQPAASQEAEMEPGVWKSLFDGKTLRGWKVTDFAGHGDVRVQDDRIILETGIALTGITYTNPLPKLNYEVRLEAMKIDGSDFFCGLTMPVADSHCTFIAGGWGGSIVGISSIDGMDASENETTDFINFEKNRWYAIRARVTPEKIETWIDDEKIVDQSIKDRRISMRFGEIELSAPFGLAAWQTKAAVRDIQFRKLSTASEKE